MTIINYLKWILLSKSVQCIWIKHGPTTKSKSQSVRSMADLWRACRIPPSVSCLEHVPKSQDFGFTMLRVLVVLPRVAHFPLKIPIVPGCFSFLRQFSLSPHCTRAGHSVSFCFSWELKSGNSTKAMGSLHLEEWDTKLNHSYTSLYYYYCELLSWVTCWEWTI